MLNQNYTFVMLKDNSLIIWPGENLANQPLHQQFFRDLASTPQVLTAHEELGHLFIRQVRDLAVPLVEETKRGCNTHYSAVYTLHTLFLKFISNLLFVCCCHHIISKFCWVGIHRSASIKISGSAHPGQAETSQVLRNVAWNTLYFAINLSRKKSEILKNCQE